MSPAAGAAGGGERRRPIASGRDGRGGGCGGPAGAVLLGLSLVGLVLYLVPAAAALAWLALGATAAWWGLSPAPRASRAFSSLARNARRQRPLFTSPPAKSAANGSLLEPRTLLEGPDPAELLLMGSYLGKPGPPQPLPAPEGRDLRERPPRRPAAWPSPPAVRHRALPAQPSPPTPLLRSSRWLPSRDCGTFPSRLVVTPRRRYPIQQAQYSLLGALPTVCWNGYHKKTVLSPRNSKMVCSPVTVRIAPPDSKSIRSPGPEQIISSTLSTPSGNVPDPCAKEVVLSALKERKKRTVEEDDQLFPDGQENKRRRHDSSGSGHSAFEPLVANGVPAAFVPKPGSLKRGFHPQGSDDHLTKRSRTSSGSSLTNTYAGGVPSSSRNAIASSYSSTRGFSQPWKRSGPSSSPLSSPASSRSQTPERPAKKSREEETCHQPSAAPPPVMDREAQGESVADPAAQKKQAMWTSPPTQGSVGQRKRKTPLLPSRRGDQLTLPPPPQLGYTITAEDLDLEKKTSLQWFNRVLEEKTDAAPCPVAENTPGTQPPLTFPTPAAGPAVSAPTLPATSSNPLLESLKKMQSPLGNAPPAQPESAEVATTGAQSPLTTTNLSAVPRASQSGPSSDLKVPDAFPRLTPESTVPASNTIMSPQSLQAKTSTPPPVPPASSPTPKPSILFGMLNTPTSNPPAAPPTSSASPLFKPVFGVPPKSEENPLSASPSVTTAPPSSSAPPATSSSSTPSFKHIFSNTGPPASGSLATPFSFKQTAAPLLTSLPSSTSTAATAPSAEAPKPTFSFSGSGGPQGGAVATSVTSASQPFLFGAPPAPGASFAPATSSMFQFGKPPAVPASTTATTFGQALPSAGQPAPGSSSSGGSTVAGFSGFGSSLTTPAPTTSSQPTLTVTTTPAFNIPFGASTKPPPPSYPGATSQAPFGATDGQQPGVTKPTLAPSFGSSSFSFGNSATATGATPSPSQPAFGSTTPVAFGGLKPPASTFGTPANTQPAFGSATAVFSFGATAAAPAATTTTTATSFGTPTQTTSSGAGSSLFGSTTPSPFAFGGSVAPAGSGGFGINVAPPSTSTTPGAFNFGVGQSGTTSTAAPFGGTLSQNTLGTSSQSTPFAFSVPNTPDSKPVFGGTSTPTFGQSTPAQGVGSSGSGLSFGAAPTAAQGFAPIGPFGSAAPSFSIGAGPKTPGARQRLQARRQHTRKK
ncbi:nuclear envelope pore membrane protein POM 121C-like [Tenrec ecaudatus]|uniref:nuclear envelope pore membrane protein POM 121C-like n=1 Tax=Tenrec ecaudatus TaxID=94439 RepID=UPI003F5935A0